jgi:hypothetical protein
VLTAHVMKRITWVVILGSAALTACGGSVTGVPGGAGTGGGAGTSGSAGSGPLPGTGGTGGTTGTGGSGPWPVGGSGPVPSTGGSGAMPGTGGSGAMPGTGGSGGLCCNSDSECPLDTECAFGRCMPTLHPGCWTDADCSANEHCSGASACPCGTMCGGPDVAGTCEPDFGCCAADGDCAAGQECVLGKCEQKPAPYRCWRNSDCPAGNCTNAYVCPCGPAAMCTQQADTQGYCPITAG